MTGVDKMMTSRPVSSMLPRAMLRPATLPTMPPPIRPLLASNMANADTPGYVARDLSDVRKVMAIARKAGARGVRIAVEQVKPEGQG